MKKKIAERWVEALRSGKYKQGKHALRSGDKFCCLGVLCNLHAEDHPKIAAKEDDPTEYLGDSSLLANPVRQWAGMLTEDGSLDESIRICQLSFGSLAQANDNGVAFTQIADWIEENYKKL